MRPSPLLALLPLALLPEANAQVQNSIDPTVRRGVLSEWGVAMLHDTSNGEILFRRSGAASGAPVAWDETVHGAESATHPDYRANSILFDDSGSFPGSGELRIRGLCSGNVVQPDVTSNGTLLQSPGGLWFGLSATISNPSIPQSGSVFAFSSNPAGVIATHYLHDSQGIAASLVGQTALEQEATDLGFPASSTVDVGDFDFGMAFITENPVPVQGSFNDRLVNVRDTLYFTLHPTQSGSTVTVPWGAAGANIAADTRTVYVVNWNTGTRKWGRPKVAFDSTVLNLTVGDEIDAIAVDDAKQQLIFSTTLGSSPSSQLMVKASHMTAPAPLKAFGGKLMTSWLGLRTTTQGNIDPDEVGGVCGWDPEANSGAYSFHGGVPEYDIGSPETCLSLSIARSTAILPGSTDGATDVLHMGVAGVQPDPSRANFVIYYHRPLTQLTDTPGFDPDSPASVAQWTNIGYAFVAPGDDQAHHVVALPAPTGSGTLKASAFVAVHITVDGTGVWAVERVTHASKMNHFD